MLIIYRREGESIYIDDHKMEVKKIKDKDREIEIEIDGQKIHIKHGSHIQFGKTYIFLLSMLYQKVEIGFEGPKEINILREEILNNKPAKKKTKKLIDNSTKQFPSGDF